METKRRNLSGIYIFEKFDTDKKRQPTCFEDCTEKTQIKWLDSLNFDAVKGMVILLGKKLRELGDAFEIEA